MLSRLEGLLEVMSLEVATESVRAGTLYLLYLYSLTLPVLKENCWIYVTVLLQAGCLSASPNLQYQSTEGTLNQ